jgi:DNA-binding SARP family transcriptional activator
VHAEESLITEVGASGVPENRESLHIYCLGPFRLRFGNAWIEDWPSLRALAILKYLAAHSRSSVSRDALMDAFWPEADAESARRNLHQAIYSLRQTLRPGGEGPQPILFENGCYRLNPEIDIFIDATDFSERIEAARRLLAEGNELEAALAFNFAAEAYTGDFLAETPGETWAEPCRIRLRNLFCEAADWLGHYFYDHNEWASAVAICRRILEYDSCHEGAHLRLMQCFAKQGQRSSAIRQYHALRLLLREELGISPSAGTQAFFTALLKEDRDGEKARDSNHLADALNPV